MVRQRVVRGAHSVVGICIAGEWVVVVSARSVGGERVVVVSAHSVGGERVIGSEGVIAVYRIVMRQRVVGGLIAVRGLAAIARVCVVRRVTSGSPASNRIYSLSRQALTLTDRNARHLIPTASKDSVVFGTHSCRLLSILTLEPFIDCAVQGATQSFTNALQELVFVKGHRLADLHGGR